ncbi:MAG TPA: hypothetical protein VNV35_11195 [Puia sp.]|nr:hypothetical protein [Puia sp.]
MKEIITYQETPIPIPHPDEAWENMRSRLLDSDPAIAPASDLTSTHTRTPAKRLLSARITITTILLLLAVLYPFHLLTPSRHPVAAIHIPSSAHNLSSANPASSGAHFSPGAHFSSGTHSSLGTRRSSATLITHPELATIPSTRASASDPSAISEPSASTLLPSLAPISVTAPHKPISAPSPASRLENTTTQPEPQYLLLQLGLQWTAQIPTDNPHTYLDGPNGRTQLYRPLLPAVWMDLQWDRSLLEFTFDPFYSDLVPLRPYSQQQNLDTISSIAVNSLQSRSLSKLFGFAAGAGYSGNLGGKWWVGGGIQTIWWTHAIVSTYTQKVEQPVGGNSARPVILFTNSTGALSKPDWSYFSTFQFDAYAQLLYEPAIGLAGFRVGFPFSALSLNQGQGPSQPLRLEVFYRLPLLARKVSAATPSPE